MATVYLAHDVRHDRKVALKVLRPELSAMLGAERFLHEIKTTANLQHPHILSLFDSGEADGLVYYVMPFIEGESLRDRLQREQQLPVEEAVRIAREVADALEYAHQRGVVHRDIKPENILLHGGHAMVVDFGIALAASKSDGGTRMTGTGISLGTPQYMAPEQAMGEREITPRADVFSLGCVLYEMLCGEAPFAGSTAQMIVARVMTEQPRSLTLQRHTIPAPVEAAVRKALEKLPADRFASAAQFSAALGNPAFVDASPRAALLGWPHDAPGQRVRVAVAIVALMLMALAGAALSRWFGPGPARAIRPVARFSIMLPRDYEPVGATGSIIAFAPDGTRFVYVGRSRAGQQLYSRALDQLEPVAIPGTANATLPFFSPDGRWLGFLQGTTLMKVPLAGGPASAIANAPGAHGASWGRGDTIVFAVDSGLMDVPAAGGRPRLVAAPDASRHERFAWPEVMPDGRAALFTVVSPREGARLAVLDRRRGAVRRLGQNGGYPRYVTAGFLVLSDGSGGVFAVPFDPGRLAVTGAAVPIIGNLQASPDGDVNLGVSRSGDFALQAAVTSATRLVQVDRGGRARDIGADTGLYGIPRLSPDGRRVAVTVAADPTFNNVDVWSYDIVQRTRTRLTFDTTSVGPLWSADGRRLAFTHPHNAGPTRLDWVAADGGSPQSLAVDSGTWFAAGFLPGGRAVMYEGSAGTPASGTELRVAALDSTRARRPLVATGFDGGASLSPDGRLVAYVSNETGRSEVYVRSFPGPGGRWQVSLDGGREPLWSPAGREIFYRDGDRVMAAAVRTESGFEVEGRTELFAGAYESSGLGLGLGLMRNYDTRDGKTFIMVQRLQGRAQAVVVTLHWFDQLRAPNGAARTTP